MKYFHPYKQKYIEITKGEQQEIKKLQAKHKNLTFVKAYDRLKIKRLNQY